MNSVKPAISYPIIIYIVSISCHYESHIWRAYSNKQDAVDEVDNIKNSDASYDDAWIDEVEIK